MEIRKATLRDLDRVAVLYDEVNEYLESHMNYPGWKKGIYPVREDAERGLKEGEFFLAEEGGQIAGSVILSHRPEAGYAQADWHVELDDADVFVVYTLAVHPRFQNQGIGRKIIEFIFEYAAERNQKAVRLDVYEKNIPAIHLYEKMGFQYITAADLGYGAYGLDRFLLYQRLL